MVPDPDDDPFATQATNYICICGGTTGEKCRAAVHDGWNNYKKPPAQKMNRHQRRKNLKFKRIRERKNA